MVKDRTRHVDGEGQRGLELIRENAMDHDPKTCSICLRTERMKYDSLGGFHFLPHDSDAAFPLFRLYPITSDH